MINWKVYQGFRDDKKVEEHCARWSTQLRRGCWVATSLSRWMGCSDPQGSVCGRESINPA